MGDLLPKSVSRRKVASALKTCRESGTCAYVKPPHAGDRRVFSSLEATGPCEVVAVDLVHALSADSPFRYILTIQDQYNRWLSAVPLLSKEAATIRDAYKAWCQSMEGDLAPTVRSDHGTEFAGDFADWLSQQEVSHELTAVGSHESNGMLERAHRELLVILRACLRDANLPDSSWADFLSLAVRKYNRRPGANLQGKSPYELRFNKCPPSAAIRTLRELLSDSPPSSSENDLLVGQRILYTHPHDSHRPKLAPVYEDAVITQKQSNNLYRIRLNANKRVTVAHRRHIRAA